MRALLVLTTAPTRPLAGKIAKRLVEKKLAACVTILGAGRSIYRWKGKTENTSEVLLWIKTSEARYPALEKQIQAIHPYEVPEVIACPVVRGSKKYLDWLFGELTP